MKRFYVPALILFMLISVLPLSAHAGLAYRGSGLVYDDDLNVTWLLNANYPAGTMTWSEAADWAENLVFGGYDDWRLPLSDTCTGKGCTESEMGHLYYLEGISAASPGIFTDVRPSLYWSSTEYDAARAWRFNFKYGTQSTGKKTQRRYVWAVRDGDVALPVVPEPAGAALFIAGGAALAVRRLRKKKVLR
ncbi:MAG: DUF1566 domain-containing protein [Deferribacteres bacterium]|nr:DUF1566 domain-containing protein [Deferribacteres bacterium]